MNSFGLSPVNGSSSDTPVGPSPEIASSVSRSGRVRKKNSLLAGFESLDELETRGRKKNDKTPKIRSAPAPKVTLQFGNDYVQATPKRPSKKMKVELMPVRPELDQDFLAHSSSAEEGDLEIDLPTEYEGGLPAVAAEEVIDESLTEPEDDNMDSVDPCSSHKLKSQAQSTYFLEKSLEKSKKVGHPIPEGVVKVKQTRKDKGSSRITAYMLWAKEQRENFAKKNPGMDLPQMSKKLSDLWATVPQNQKKIWKIRAAKEMKKALHMNDKLKHSGPKPVVQTVRLKPGRKPKFPKVVPTPPSPDVVTPQPSTSRNSKMKTTFSPEVNGHSAKVLTHQPSPRGRPKQVVTNGKGKISPAESPKVSPRGRPPTKAATTAAKSPNLLPSNHRTNHLPSNSTAKPERRFLNKGPGSRNGFGGSAHSPPKTNSVPVQPKYNSPKKEEEAPMYKVNTTSPLDVAAHFSLLGESLSLIGDRLRAHEGENISGSLSVLLDSMLCALGPLACLTKQVPEMNVIPDRNLTNILDDIAYIMPGL